MEQINTDIRELKRLRQFVARKLSEAALNENRDDIIMYYNSYRDKEREICKLEDILKNTSN